MDHTFGKQTVFLDRLPFLMLSIASRLGFLKLAYGLLCGANDAVR